jgi:hypothetical protein
MRHLILVSGVLAVACSPAPAGPNTQRDGNDVIAIRYGESIVVPGTILEVGFQALLADSRCPSDVVCVWEGEGRVELGVTLGDGPTMPVELNTGGLRSTTHGGYTITLVELDPYPVSTRPHVPEDYIVRVQVRARVPLPD